MTFKLNSQINSKEFRDSVFLHEVEETNEPHKNLHAEPLYIDLIRDLGARKGEKEWNIAFGLTDNQDFDKYSALVEYEWAPIDRLGLEIELPFTYYYNSNGRLNPPGSKLNSIKLAGQYTFLVHDQLNTSIAIGYIHEFEMAEFKKYQTASLFTGQIFNPFLIAAKRWQENWHSLIYTGPLIHQTFGHSHLWVSYQINSSIHYMIKGTRNFIGIEFNKELNKNDFDMTIRPQMRLGISENLLVGIVTGIPINREIERFSTFIRIIYEPGHVKINRELAL